MLAGIQFLIPMDNLVVLKHFGPTSNINFLRSLTIMHLSIIQKHVCGIENCPWLNKNIKLNICITATIFSGKREKQTTWRTGQIIGISEIAIQETLKRLRQTITGELSQASGGDHWSFWKTMKKILPGEKKLTSPSICVNRTLSSDKRCIASAFNTFSRQRRLG